MLNDCYSRLRISFFWWLQELDKLETLGCPNEDHLWGNFSWCCGEREQRSVTVLAKFLKISCCFGKKSESKDRVRSTNQSLPFPDENIL